MMQPESAERRQRALESRKMKIRQRANLKRLCAELDQLVTEAESKPLRKGQKTRPRLELEARAEEVFTQIRVLDALLA